MAMVPIFVALAAAQDWWDPAWPCRRPVTVTAGEAGIAAGTVIEVDLGADPMPYGVRVVEGSRPVRFVAETEWPPGRVWFRLAEAIPASGSRRFDLYYGNREAPPASDPAGVFAAYIPLGQLRDVSWPDGWSAAADGSELRLRAAEGALETPLRIPEIRGPWCVELRVRGVRFDGEEAFIGLRLPERSFNVPEDLRPRLENIIRRLGADSWEERERAQSELTEIGAPALAAVREAARSPDSEVAHRAQVVLETLEEAAEEQDRFAYWDIGAGRELRVEVQDVAELEGAGLGPTPDICVLRAWREEGPGGPRVLVAGGPARDSAWVAAPVAPMSVADEPPAFALVIEIPGGGALQATLVDFRAWPTAPDARVEVGVAEERRP